MRQHLWQTIWEMLGEVGHQVVLQQICEYHLIINKERWPWASHLPFILKINVQMTRKARWKA